ncbi:preprotein translocase subunit SecE [Mycoplasma sp. 21DD0573]|uniref:preprotein translocase subunit SecE n=1 Tax=unclassified Mycoplasma TaxID=2683645 RepID=UPI002B1D0E9D|nr:preprotein translocase subunit SecE [Mycoplasma sp. 21DD0573]MEA4276291.1 preprotein translocase subunit SecE [Mycoplasma sp. 21DD0573]
MIKNKKAKTENVETAKMSLEDRFESRNKIYFFRKTVKEIKRVRWATPRQNWINLVKILVFTAIFALFVYAVTIGFTKLWEVIGSV